MSEAPEPTTLERPRVFGDYQLTARLAQGGMGEVYLAKRLGFRPDIQHFCAVKTIRPGRGRDDFVRRFHDEARVVVKLNHPGICHVFDVGIVDGEHYLAMELIEGVSLQEVQRARAAAGERFSTPLALAIIDAVLEALDYAHRRIDPTTGASLRIVHRDISPQNVMLTFTGAVKLIDFGLVTSTLKVEQTTGGLVVGKLGYMSPEQSRGDALDARTDVYSTAVMLYELLAARRFYGDLGKNAIMMHLTEGTWMPPLDVVPEALRAPLAHALAAEPAARTSSCAELQRELADAISARAAPRELREALDRLVPQQGKRLARLMHGAEALPAPVVEEVTRSVVTHVARSDEDVSELEIVSDATSRTTALTDAASPPKRPWGLLAVALAGAALTWLGWFALAGTVDGSSQERAADGGIAAASVTAVLPAALAPPEPTTLAPTEPAAVAPPSPPTLAQETAKERAPKPRRPPRPPATRLPDLAAKLDYLSRWCAPHAPTCTRAVLAQRGRVPLLDAVGLRALHQDADACVVECRR